MGKRVILIFVLVLLVPLVLGATWNDSLDESLISYWDFDFTTGTSLTNRANSTANGTLMNMTDANWVTGIRGNALNFINYDNSFVNITDRYPPIANFTGGNVNQPFTISWWMNVTSTLPSQDIFSRGVNTRVWGIQLGASTITVDRKEEAASQHQITFNNVHVNNTILNNWSHHTVIFINETNVEYYQNGVRWHDNSTGSIDLTTNVTNSNMTFKLGFGSHRFASPSQAEDFNNTMDELGIWDRALAVNQILDLYNNGSGLDRSPSISDTLNLTVLLERPPDNTANSTNSHTFRCSANGTSQANNIDNVTFNMWDSTNSIEATTFRDVTNALTANESFTVSSIGDDAYNWNCIYSLATIGNSTYADFNYSLTVDTIFPTVGIDQPSGIFNQTEETPIDFTANDTNSLTCKYTTDGGVTNTTIGSCANTSFTASSFGTTTFELFVSDSAGNEFSNLSNFTSILLSPLNFSNEALEGDNQNFSMFFTNSSAILTSAILKYNNTDDSGATTTSNDTAVFLNKSIITNILNDTSRNRNLTVNMSLSFSFEGNTTTFTTNTGLQETYKKYLDDCTLGVTTQLARNYTVDDEETGVNISTFDISHLYSPLDVEGNVIRTFNFTSTDVNSSSVCIFPQWGNFTVNTRVHYSVNTTYDERDFIFDALTFSNASIDTTLLLLKASTSTDVTVNVRDQNDNNLEGYTVEAYKFNIITNSYDLAQTGITDFSGKTLMQLDTSETYRFIISLDGVEKLRKDNIKLIGASPELFFVVVIGESDPLQPVLDATDFDYTLTFNQSGNSNVSLSWLDTGNTASLVCLIVENVTRGNNQVLFNQCSTSDASDFNFSFFNLSEHYKVTARMDSEFDGSTNYLQQLFIDLRKETKLTFFGGEENNNDGLFWALIIIGTLGGIGLSTGNPIITVLLTLLGTGMAFFMGFLPMTAAGIMALVALGGFVMYMLRT